jgi:Flp pilus assembly protein TadD
MTLPAFSITWGLALALVVASVACGDGKPAAAPDAVWQTCPDGSRVERFSNACPPVAVVASILDGGPSISDGGAASRAAPALPVFPAFPAPKPTTISLARTGDATIDALLASGDAAFETGDLAKAEAAYVAARKAAPKRAGAAVGVARVRIARASPGLGYASAEKNKDVLAASRDLAAATKAEPTFGPAWVEHGRALLLLGDAQGAETSLAKGVQLLPDEAEAHSALGVALLATGKSEQAVLSLTKARDLDPGSAARRGNLGTVLFMRSRVADAIAEYELQARLAPDDARAHSDLGTALLAAQDMPRAEAELRRAIQLDPGRATFRSNLGYALQLQGKVAEAIAEYRRSLDADPKLVSAWVNLATALSRDPKTRSEARRALEAAKRLDPSDPRVKANLDELDALAPDDKPATSPR